MGQTTVGCGLRIAALCLTLIGCATSTTTAVPTGPPPSVEPPVAETPFVPPPSLGPVFAPGQVVEPVPGGSIDWSGKTVWGRGTGVLDPGNSNRSLARQMAERAATVVAQRNLLEIVKNIRVDSDNRVQDIMALQEPVYRLIEEVVKTARPHGPVRYDSIGGTVEVSLECDLYGAGSIASAVAPPSAGPPSGSDDGELQPAAQEFLRQYSAIMIDGGSSGLKPALFPKICDDTGMLLFDSRALADAGTGVVQAVQYVGTLDQLLARPDFGQPLLIRARGARGKLGTDAAIARAEAGVLRQSDDVVRFLADNGRLFIKLAP